MVAKHQFALITVHECNCSVSPDFVSHVPCTSCHKRLSHPAICGASPLRMTLPTVSVEVLETTIANATRLKSNTTACGPAS